MVPRLLGALQRLSRHRLLDRLIRGRTWIALVTFALIGIVTLQLGLLKLNAGIGRSLERSALLQRENAALSIENSELAAGNRVEATATHLGMQLVAPGVLRFLSIRPHVDAAQASAALAAQAHAPTTSTESSTSATSTGESATSEPASSESTGSESTGGESSASSEQASTPEASSAATPPPSSEAAASTGTASAPTSESAPAAGSAETTPAGGTQASPGG